MKIESSSAILSVGASKSKPAVAPFHGERWFWRTTQAVWRPLYGGFYDSGVSLEWHDVTANHPFDWARSFHPGSLELCLNLEGSALVNCGESVLQFQPGTAGFYLPEQGEVKALRAGEQKHRFLTAEFSTGFLADKLGGSDGALHPLVESFLRSSPRGNAMSGIFALTLGQQEFLEQALRPPVAQGARALWYESKVLQLIADFFFARPAADELFCDRQKRLARERVNRAIDILRQNLAEPPNLEGIGRAVGCSPFYLSRTFSSETKMTIPQYLRKLRMERAAELLKSGKYNVTEAALEVGYSSLSHFSQAFCQTMGCCPALYPMGLRKA